jgi:hypothetical protein
MPFIRDYSEDEEGEEDKIVMPPRESPFPTALHETLHVVVLRLDGLDIADVVENDDAAWTRLVPPQKYTIAALMAPEVYMTLNDIAFTDESVSSDRQAVRDCFRAEHVEDLRRQNREFLELIFQCPYVRAAISILTVRMHDELCEHQLMHGPAIHEIIDPILKCSPFADGLTASGQSPSGERSE